MHLFLFGVAFGVVIGHVVTSNWPTISAWISKVSEPK